MTAQADFLARIREHSATLSGRTAPAPEWGIACVHFRRATARQADDFGKLSGKDGARASFDLILALACDAQGERLFQDTAETRAALAAADAQVILRLVTAAASRSDPVAALEDEKKD
jgi:hypothetical protein